MDNDNRTLGDIFGGKAVTIKRLADETRATLTDAKTALEDANYNVEEARELLRQRDQIETPEKRRRERAKKIEELTKSKPSWRRSCEEFCRKKMAELDEQIARLEEEQRRDV